MFFAQSFNVSMILNSINISSVNLYLLTQHHLLMLHQINLLLLWINLLMLQSCLRIIEILFMSFTALLRTSNEMIATFVIRLTLTWSWSTERNDAFVINASKTEESILMISRCNSLRMTWTHCVYSSIFLNCFWLRKC